MLKHELCVSEKEMASLGNLSDFVKGNIMSLKLAFKKCTVP